VRADISNPHGDLKLKMTTAMQAGIADTFLTFYYVVARIDAEIFPVKMRGRYKKRVAA